MMDFAKMCNAKSPEVVLDLGDSIEGERSDLYPMEHCEAALAQMQNWLKAWNHIEAEDKEIALGNRCVARHEIRREEEWKEALGSEDRPEKGGSKLQTSFVVENDCVKALFIVTSSYSECHDRSATVNWVVEEVLEFDGDFIVFADHRISLYRNFRDMLMEHEIKTPAIFLHGHNHGPDTLVRDAWGRETEKLDFPAYLLTALMSDGIAAKFQLYPEGRYEKYRLDVSAQEISEPRMHHQTRVRD